MKKIQGYTIDKEVLKTDYSILYKAFFELTDIKVIQPGNKIVDKLTNIEYTIDVVNIESNPLTATEYLSATIKRIKSTTTGSINYRTDQ